MTERHDLSFTLNGEAMTATVEARLNLADFLRHTLHLTGTHVGCEHGVCGACNVMIDGRSVRSCLTLAVQADGASIETIEGLTASGAIADLQREFVARNALQCGYCTPGMLATATELLSRGTPTRMQIRDALSGNYCRCTGYQAIVDAVEAVAIARAEAKP
jgi:aerobic carbon-monoxide dehydrogenase small subunit